MKVLKFGGSSLATPERIQSVINIVQPSWSDKSLKALVVSAFGGVTDMLIPGSTACLSGRPEFEGLLNQIRQRHWMPEGLDPGPKQASAGQKNYAHEWTCYRRIRAQLSRRWFEDWELVAIFEA